MEHDRSSSGSGKLNQGRMTDIISMLPDDILYHILSFLPTKQSVATSVLSRRWRLLCTSVDYDSIVFHSKRRSWSFIKNVNTTILSRDLHPSMHPPIRKFRLQLLSFESDNPYAKVHAWINVLIRQQIESLDLSLASEVSLSCRVFRCKTLVVLKLSSLSIFGRSSVQLPSLKSLHLVNVVFGQPKYLMKFLYGLPMLEDLKVHSLQYTEDVDDSFFKEEFKSLPKLIRADLLSMKECPDIPLEAICNVESLRIGKNGLDKVVCVFPNLIHVVITFVSSWNFVFEMLKNCPKLQVFELVLFGYPLGALIYPDVVPQCLTSHFTKCSLEEYIGREAERRFAKYIMQNSTTLQTMTICSHLRSLQLRYAMVEELTLCPKLSPLCELSFNYLSDY